MGLFDSIVGPLVGGALSFLGGERANSANQKMAQAQMDFQSDMRNTQYQAAMADMRKAGLNPILAYKTGGAGTPSGTSAVMQNSVAAGVDGFNSVTNSAATYKKLDPETRLIEQKIWESNSQEALNDETQKVQAVEIKNRQQQRKLIEAQAEAQRQQAAVQRAQERGLEIDNSARALDLAVQAAGQKALMRRQKIESNHPHLQFIDSYVDRIGRMLGGAGSAKKLFSK